MKHELKIEPDEFLRVSEGTKRFVIYRGIGSVQKGDTLILKEWDSSPVNSTSGTPKGFTDSEPLHFRVGFVDDNRIVSIIPLEPDPQDPPPKTKKPKG